MPHRERRLFQGRGVDVSPLEQVRQTGGGRRDPLGLDPRRPFEILFGVGEPTVQGLIPNIVQGFKQVFGTGAEAVAEAGEQVFDVGGDVLKTLGDINRRLAALEEPAVGAAREALLGPEEEEEDDRVEILEGPSPSDIRREELAVEQELREIQDRKAENFAALESLDQLAEQQLDPASQQQIAQLRQQTQDQLAELQTQEQQLTAMAERNEDIFESLEERLFGETGGLVPGITTEEEEFLADELSLIPELDEEPGVSNRLFEFAERIQESDLPDDEKERRLQFLAERAQEVVDFETAMNQLLDDRKALEEVQIMPDAELLGQEGSFTNTKLRMDLQIDPLGRALSAVGEEVERVLENRFGATLEPGMLDALVGDPAVSDDGVLDLVILGQLEPGSDELFRLIDGQISNGDTALTQAIMDAIDNGLETAGIREAAWGESLNQRRFEAGSYGLVAALIQVGLGLGLDPQTAAAIAEDRNLHYIVSAKTNGIVGFEGANQFGIGALTPEAYRRVGLPYDQIQGSEDQTEQELAALILYMLESGEPALTIQRFFQTGIWGN